MIKFTSGHPLSVFCSLLWKKEIKTSWTHHVSDEILQSASLNILRNQIEPLVFVQHTDKLQNVRVIEATHYFDLVGRVTRKKNNYDKQVVPNQFLAKGKGQLIHKEKGVNTNQTNVFPQAQRDNLKITKSRLLGGVVCFHLWILTQRQFCLRNHSSPAADYQPLLGKFSVSLHRSGSAPSSPSPLLWLCESPVMNTNDIWSSHGAQRWIERLVECWWPTLMACPKKPFPKTSPWMRSHGRKMRWEQLLEDLRDSERPMSLVIKGDSLGEFGPGDLHILLLRLGLI